MKKLEEAASEHGTRMMEEEREGVAEKEEVDEEEVEWRLWMRRR